MECKKHWEETWFSNETDIFESLESPLDSGEHQQLKTVKQRKQISEHWQNTNPHSVGTEKVTMLRREVSWRNKLIFDAHNNMTGSLNSVFGEEVLWSHCCQCISTRVLSKPPPNPFRLFTSLYRSLFRSPSLSRPNRLRQKDAHIESGSAPRFLPIKKQFLLL